MINLYDKWKESVVTVYDSQELSTLELLEDITSFNEEIAKGIDGLDSKLETELSNKTDLNGDHKGSWQGLSRPTLSEEGMRATVEKLNADVPKLENDIVKINSSLEQNETQLIAITNQISYYISPKKLSQANYSKDLIWYEDNEFKKVTGDSSLIINEIIQQAFKNNIKQVVIPYGKYIVKSTINIPCWINVDFSHCELIPTHDGVYKDNYMIYINYEKTPYGGDYYSTVEKIHFENKLHVPNIRGIYQGSSGTLQYIQSHMMYNTITRGGEYLDFTKIYEIHVKANRGDEYQIIIPNVGDGLVIDRVFSEVWDSLASPTGKLVFVRGCNGGEISRIINGSIYLGDCSAMSLNNLHLENGNIIFENTSATINDSIIYKRKGLTPIISKNRTSDGTKRSSKVININNVNIAYWNARYDTGVKSIDLDLIGTSVANINGFYRIPLKDDGDLGSNCQTSATVGYNGVYLEKFTKNALNSYSSLVTPEDIVSNLQCSMQSLSSGSGAYLYQDLYGWQLSKGTYYYKIQFLDDVERMLGFNGGAETSITIEELRGVKLDLSSTQHINRIVRIYRGTSSKSYDKIVDIPIACGGYLFDNGVDVCGFKWGDRVAGDVDEINVGYQIARRTNKNIEVFMPLSSIPPKGTWNKYDIVRNSNLSTGETSYWVYRDGTSWKSMGTIL